MPFLTPPLVLTGLQPLGLGWVGLGLLVFRLATGTWGLRASAFPSPWTNLHGSCSLFGYGDAGCGLISGGSPGGAGMGAQNPNEISIRAVHVGGL